MKNLSKIIPAVFACLFLLTTVSCSKNGGVLNSTSCHPDQAVLSRVTNEVGVFGYDSGIKLNTLTVTKGSVTSVYFICNPPATLPALNASVTFSGDVRTSTRSAVGSTSYYELTVTSFQ